MPYDLKVDNTNHFVEVELRSYFSDEIQKVYDLEISILANSNNRHAYLITANKLIERAEFDTNVEETFVKAIRVMPIEEKVAVITTTSALASFLQEFTELRNLRVFEDRASAVIWLEA